MESELYCIFVLLLCQLLPKSVFPSQTWLCGLGLNASPQEINPVVWPGKCGTGTGRGRWHGGLDLKDHARRLRDVEGQRYFAAWLGLFQVVDEVGDHDDGDPHEAGETHHLAVVGDDLGDGAHQDQASKLQQVDGRLGVPFALTNRASAGMMCPGQCSLAGTKG